MAEVVADGMQMLGRKEDSSARQSSVAAGSSNKENADSKSTEEEIPF